MFVSASKYNGPGPIVAWPNRLPRGLSTLDVPKCSITRYNPLKV